MIKLDPKTWTRSMRVVMKGGLWVNELGAPQGVGDLFRWQK
jgi:hypothetical protein